MKQEKRANADSNQVTSCVAEGTAYHQSSFCPALLPHCRANSFVLTLESKRLHCVASALNKLQAHSGEEQANLLRERIVQCQSCLHVASAGVTGLQKVWGGVAAG